MRIKSESPQQQTIQADRLKAERVQLRLAALPGWKLRSGEERITRRFRFSSPESAAAFAGLVFWLAHDRDHYPEIRIHRERMFLSLGPREAAGLSERDLELAEAISREL